MEEISIANDTTDDLEDSMATTSLMHNFIVSNPESVAKFVKALEEAANDPPRPISNKFRYLQDPDEIREFMERRRAMLAAKKSAEEEERE